MKTISACILLAILTKISYSQTPFNQTFLEGSWQYVYHYYKPDTNQLSFEKYYLTEYQFDKSGTFKLSYYAVTTINHDTCLRASGAGFYKLSKRGELKIKQYQEGFAPNSNGLHNLIGRLSAKTIYLDEVYVSSDTLEERYQDRYSNVTYFKKLNQPIQATQNGLDSCNYKNFYQAVILPQQQPTISKDLYLINSLDSTQVVRIPENRNLDFYYKEELIDSIYKYKSLNGFGYIDSIYEDSIVVSLYQMDINLSDENDFESLYTTASIYGEETPDFKATIDLDNMPEIGFSTNTSDALQSISAIGMASGLFTALILAPLLSIDYNSGEFRDQRYYKIAGYSLGVVAISVPLSLFSGSKSYTIIPTGAEPDKNKWYLSY